MTLGVAAPLRESDYLRVTEEADYSKLGCIRSDVFIDFTTACEKNVLRPAESVLGIFKLIKKLSQLIT